jgi:short-subunit dehydrogenase
MARRGAKNFILISRNGLKSGKVQELVSELLPRGIRIDVFRGDVANDSDLERILTESSKSLPPIKGVIHTAMVLKVNALEYRTNQDFILTGLSRKSFLKKCVIVTTWR